MIAKTMGNVDLDDTKITQIKTEPYQQKVNVQYDLSKLNNCTLIDFNKEINTNIVSGSVIMFIYLI